jgi:hypothetical protein
MDSYMETLNSIGDALLQWADPEGQFGGYTKVSDTFASILPWILSLARSH